MGACSSKVATTDFFISHLNLLDLTRVGLLSQYSSVVDRTKIWALTFAAPPRTTSKAKFSEFGDEEKMTALEKLKDPVIKLVISS